MMLWRCWYALVVLVFAAYGQPRVLVVQAHPDDETGCAALLFGLARYSGAVVDICVITNGEAGYRYSTLAEKLYGLPLTIDSVGRAHLPGIRKQEMLHAAAVLGVRNVYFLDERDHAYNQSLEMTMAVWDTTAVISRLKRLLHTQEYDVAIGLLPTRTTHGGHKAATYLLLRAASEARPSLLVLGVLSSDTVPRVELEPFAQQVMSREPLAFDRSIRFGFNRRLDMTTVVRWIAAEHRSQGLMTLSPVAHREYYWVLSPATEEGYASAQQFLFQLVERLRAQLPNYLPGKP